MAVVLGPRKCAKCGKDIAESKKYYSLPAFIPPWHDLSKYNEGAFHFGCLEGWDDGTRLVELTEKFKRSWAARPKDRPYSEAVEWNERQNRELFGEPPATR